MTAALVLAVSAGALAAFNPCGFALLPGYLALFLGGEAGQGARPGTAIARALGVGLAVTTGFVLVFGVVGLAVTALSVSLGDWLSFVTIGSGLLLVAVGAWLFSGREVNVRVPTARLRIDGSVRGMVAYGVVYATVSLSCTLPVFLAAVVSTFTLTGEGATPAVGALALLGYAAGMGAVLVVLALLTALFGQSVVQRARGATPHVKRISAAFLIVAGAYVVWYGWVEYQAFQGNLITAGPAEWVGAASSAVSAFLAGVPSALVVGGVVVVLLGAVLAVVRSRAAAARSRDRDGAGRGPTA